MGFSPGRSALRGIGSSAVVASHAIQITIGYTGAGLLFYLGWHIEIIGWMGVVLFLTLSIYLLMGSLDTHAGPAGPKLKHYFWRRIQRIWPIYFGFCIIVFLFIDHNVGHLLWNASFLATLLNNSQAFTSPNPLLPLGLVWTLQVEEMAYVSFPFIAMLNHRHRLWVGWGLIGFSAAYMLFGPNVYTSPWDWLAAYGAGLLFYEMRGAPVWTAPTTVAVVGLALMPFLVHGMGWPMGILLVLPLMGCLVARPPAFLRRAALVAVGECSYALYLTHILWLDLLGVAGVPFAYIGAWLVESVQRHKEMSRRVRLVRATRQ